MGVVDLSDDLDAPPLDLSESVTTVILIANGIVYTVDVLDAELMAFLQNNAVQVANVA